MDEVIPGTGEIERVIRVKFDTVRLAKKMAH